MKIQGQRFLVTGAGGAIGRAIANTLLAENGTVVALDKDPVALTQINPNHPNLMAFQAAVSKPYQMEVVAEKLAASNLLPLHGIINNAGEIASAPLFNIMGDPVKQHDPSLWDRVIENNLCSTFHTTNTFISSMIMEKIQGVIINISSIAAAGNPGQSAYSAAKAGVNALTMVWAKELGPMGIRVVGISPGFIDTKSTKQHLSTDKIQMQVAKTPLKRLGTLADITDAIQFAIHHPYLTGTILDIHGGLSVS